MLKDSFDRIIDYARISLTDKCNMRCRYCIPKEGVKLRAHEDLLKFEEMYFLLKIFKELGIKKFRFTGGEPFVKRNAMDFFENLNIGEFYITTNLSADNLDIGRLNNLNLAGLNISLDTLNPEKYEWLSRGSKLEPVIKNIRALNVKNIKLNAVIIKDFNEDEIKPLINFAAEIGATMRFIEKMNFLHDNLQYASLNNIRKKLISENFISPEKTTPNNSVAVYHEQISGKGNVGFIMPVSKPFCASCNRIRLSSDGGVKLCLFAKQALNLRNMLKEGKGKDEIKKTLIKTVLTKLRVPENYSQNEAMSAIGG
ncbi:MAG: radical SAM protein [Elusimicrobiota bacterium]|nr:radical SAM protein [Elusimicrobiota bacterium]